MAALAMLQYGSGAAITAILHPFGFSKVLMQVGHEPLLPIPSTTVFFRRRILRNPNILKYLGHIWSVDGFSGLYRGVVPRVLAGTVGNLVQYNISDKFNARKDAIKKKDETQDQPQEEEDLIPWLVTFAKETAEDTFSRSCGVIVSHPFHVIMVRSMVQFIGRETQYDSIFSSIREIYQQDGILGFFAGLIPRLVGEVLTIWMTSFLTQAIHKYVIHDKDMKSYTGAVCGLVVTHFTYPFTLVTNIMAVNNSGLKGGGEPFMPVYTSWWNCMQVLSQERELNRGASAFWRVYRQPLTHPTIIPLVDSTGKLKKL